MYFRFRCICLFPCQTFRLFILQFMWSLSLDQIGHWSQERKVQSPSECQQLGDVMSKNFVRIHFGTLFRSIATGKIRRRIRTDYHLNPYNFAQRSFSHTGKHWNIVFFFCTTKNLYIFQTAVRLFSFCWTPVSTNHFLHLVLWVSSRRHDVCHNSKSTNLHKWKKFQS